MVPSKANATIEQKLSDIERRLAKLEGLVFTQNTGATFIATEKKLSTNEFLMAKNLKSETATLLALGYYLEHIEGMGSFNVSDLETAFRSSKIKPPENMNDKVNKNIARGFLMEAAEKKDNKKAWLLTRTGEKCVVEELS